MSALQEQPVILECAAEPLVAVLHPARATSSLPGVLVVVGGPQYRVGSHRQFVLMARVLAQAGYAVMRFDYRGMGDSGGGARTFEHALDDIRTAIDAFSRSVPGMPGVVIWGLCDGASAALLHAAGDRRVRGMILVNPWVRTDSGQAKAYVEQYYGQRLLQRSFWRKLFSGRVNVVAAVRSFVSALLAARTAPPSGSSGTEHFIARMLSGFELFAGPALVLISGKDLTAAEFTALCRDDPRWRRAMSRPAVRVSTLADADHTFSSRAALDAAVRICIQWLSEVASGEGSPARAEAVIAGTQQCR